MVKQTMTELTKLLSRYSADWMLAGYSLVDYLLIHKAYYKKCNVYGQLQAEIGEYFRKFPEEKSLANKDKFGRNYNELAEECQYLIMNVEQFYMELATQLMDAYPTETLSGSKLYKWKLVTLKSLCEEYKVVLGSNPMDNHNRVMRIVEGKKHQLNLTLMKFIGLWEQFESLEEDAIMGVNDEDL